MDDVLRYYLDEHIDPAISKGLRMRGIDVLTTEEAGRAHQGLTDSDQLAYAAAQERVLVTGTAISLSWRAASFLMPGWFCFGRY